MTIEPAAAAAVSRKKTPLPKTPFPATLAAKIDAVVDDIDAVDLAAAADAATAVDAAAATAATSSPDSPATPDAIAREHERIIEAWQDGELSDEYDDDDDVGFEVHAVPREQEEAFFETEVDGCGWSWGDETDAKQPLVGEDPRVTGPSSRERDDEAEEEEEAAKEEATDGEVDGSTAELLNLRVRVTDGAAVVEVNARHAEPSPSPSPSASASASPSPSLPPMLAAGEFAFDRSPSPLGTATPGSDADAGGGGATGGNGEITLGWGGSEFGGSSKGNGTPRTPPVGGVGSDAGGATTRLDDAADALRAWAATGDRTDRDADADADAAGEGEGEGEARGTDAEGSAAATTATNEEDDAKDAVAADVEDEETSPEEEEEKASRCAGAETAGAAGEERAEDDDEDEDDDLTSDDDFDDDDFDDDDDGGDFTEFNLRVVHRLNRTGFETSKEFPARVGVVVAGRYQLTDHLGSAAFSTALRARDLVTGECVCVKIIKNNKDYFDQSLDEVKLLTVVNDADPEDAKGILRMYDYFYHREHLFIVTELLRSNLYEFQKHNVEAETEPYFTLKTLRSIARQILTSLEFLHGLDIIHADLKPENVLIRSYTNQTVKVIDLGSSCYVTDHLSSYVQSRSYRAPEVIVGAPYGVKIDVWSLGCVLAELYTGEVLFQNDGVASMLARCVGVLGPFDPALLRRGRHAAKFFTKSGLIYERDERSGELRVFEPKRTTLRARLGFATKREGGFVDFLLALLRPNPDARLRCVPYTGPRTTALAW